MTRYWMGVDGGGSSLRVTIVDDSLHPLGEAHAETANPKVIGEHAAAERIHMAILAAISNAQLQPADIAGVGIGIAGADTVHSEVWLREVVSEVLPQARLVPSADYEIALVGALGERRGILVLAGTGSLAYGVNAHGESMLVGGWGYLLGDEGGGYWLGLEALRALIADVEGRGEPTLLHNLLLDHLNLVHPRDLVKWMYATQRTRDVAALAPLVLRAAESGDAVALSLVNRGADALLSFTHTVMRRLKTDNPQIAFAGGLLENTNPLSRALCMRLGLNTLPVAQYPAAVGAALLCREMW
jgi:glucosamine kinase